MTAKKVGRKRKENWKQKNPSAWGQPQLDGRKGQELSAVDIWLNSYVISLPTENPYHFDGIWILIHR